MNEIILYGKAEYTEPIEKYFKENFSYPLKRNDSFWNLYHNDDLYRIIAAIRVLDPFNKDPLNTDVHPIEINFERERIQEQRGSTGAVYEGYNLLRIYQEYLPLNHRSLQVCPIIVTEELFATYYDGRYHLRTCLLGFPHLISVPGIVQAPARSAKHYIYKSVSETIESEEDCLTDSDPRISQALILMALRAAAYHLGVEENCQVKFCALYDAHTQQELLAQINQGICFCDKHKNLLS